MTNRQLIFHSFHLALIHAFGMAAAVILIYWLAPPSWSWEMLAGSITALSVFFRRMMFYCRFWTRFGCALSLLALGYIEPFSSVWLVVVMGLIVWLAQMDNLYHRDLAARSQR